MTSVLENSETPTPVHPRAPRYLHYRNAQPVYHDNLWQVELGMGRNPRVWRIAFLSLYDGRLYVRGHMRRVYEQSYHAFWMGRGQFLWTATIRGRNLTEEQAKAMLFSLAEANV